MNDQAAKIPLPSNAPDRAEPEPSERSGFSLESALTEINRLSTTCTSVVLVEFVRKNLFFLTAFRTRAHKGLQMLMAFESRAVLGCCHVILLGARVFPAHPSGV